MLTAKILLPMLSHFILSDKENLQKAKNRNFRHSASNTRRFLIFKPERIIWKQRYDANELIEPNLLVKVDIIQDVKQSKLPQTFCISKNVYIIPENYAISPMT